jgi:hypothetical protein
MARSVVITTPIPTLDEIGDRLGMSQARRQRLLRIVRDAKTGEFLTHKSTSTTGRRVVRSRKVDGKVVAGRKKS